MTRDRGRSSRAAAVALFAPLVLALVLALATPAAAHTGLASSDPAADAVVEGPVEEVTLTFTKPVTLVDGGTELFDGDGGPVEIASVDQPSTDQIVVHPTRPLTDTSYGLRWAARAEDGHVLDGTFSFTVSDDPASADTAAAPAEDRAPAGGPPTAPGDHEVTDDLASALEDSEPSTTAAQVVAWLARTVVYAGVLFAIGGMAYLFFVHEGTPVETRRLVFWIRRAAVVVLAAVVVQGIAMIARTHQGAFSAVTPLENWGHTFGGSSGIGLGLAAAGSIAIALGLRMSIDQTTRTLPLGRDGDGHPGGKRDRGLVAEEPIAVVEATSGPDDAALTTSHLAVTTRLTRLRLADSRVALAGALAILLSFLFLGHTTSEGPRLLTSVADVVHVGAGAVWSGGAVLLAAALWRRRRTSDPLPGSLLVARYSHAATIAIIAVAVSGTGLAVIILPDASAIWSTTFGRILVAKTAVVGGLVGLGAINHYRCVPALRADPFDTAASTLLRRVVSAEVVGFVLVLALTGALVGSSPT